MNSKGEFETAIQTHSLREKIVNLLDDSTVMNALIYDEAAEIKIEKIVEQILGNLDSIETYLPSNTEIQEIDAKVNEARYVKGFSSSFETNVEFVINFIRIIAQKANKTVPNNTIVILVTKEFSEPPDKDWKPVLEQILESFKVKFPEANIEVTENEVLVVRTGDHTITLRGLGQEGISLDFLKTKDGVNDDESIEDNLETGSITVAKYLKFLAIKVTKDLQIKLYVNPSNKRREKAYQWLAKHYHLTNLIQLNRSRER